MSILLLALFVLLLLGWYDKWEEERKRATDPKWQVGREIVAQWDRENPRWREKS